MSGESVNINFRLQVEKKKALDELAAAMDRDRTYLINEAISAYLDVHRWQLEDLRKAIAEADAGDFATDEEVAAAFAKHIPNAD